MTIATPTSCPKTHLATLFSFTLFLSAAIMFALQPMVGRMLLPIVGGAPSGWVVAMAFFQVMLLLGYFVAYALSSLPARLHGVVYIILMAAGALFLPVRITSAEFSGALPGAFDIFLLLGRHLAFPFIALSATSSTLQRLFMSSGHPSAKDPYFLYAASNIGSFAGLFAYPFAAEPLLGLQAQSAYWFYGYGALICLGFACLMSIGKTAVEEQKARAAHKKISLHDFLFWILLAFVPSALLLAVTTHITTEIFSLPLLWVVPLAAYLLTFVFSFMKKPPIDAKTVAALFPIAVIVTIFGQYARHPLLQFSVLMPALHVIAFFFIALYFHMRLVEKRPIDDGRGLAAFYLALSIGGALGGILNAFILPHVLDSLVELPLLLIFALLLHPEIKKGVHGLIWKIAIAAFALLCLRQVLSTYENIVTLADVLLAMALLLAAVNVRVLAAAVAIVFTLSFFSPTEDIIYTARNFYGTVKVKTGIFNAGEKKVPVVYMLHGTTVHGFKLIGAEYEKTPTSYYAIQSPISTAFKVLQPRTVAAVGLGTGTISCLSPAKSVFTYIEIDAEVVSTARKYFPFLEKCNDKRPAEIIVGDGRLELQRLDGHRFDMIVMDAFSSDTIPVHLLTTEAFNTYAERLEKNGAILVNISNRYFNLSKPIANAAFSSQGMKTLMFVNLKIDPPASLASVWLAVSRDLATIQKLKARGWKEVATDDAARPWTDDYNNLLSHLRF